MCECGCVSIRYERRIVDANGMNWLIGVYPSCGDCSTPAGVQFFRCDAETSHLWDAESVPEFGGDGSDDGLFFMSVADPLVARKHMKRAIIGYEPESGIIDDIDADVLADEAFFDFRSIVSESRYRP